MGRRPHRRHGPPTPAPGLPAEGHGHAMPCSRRATASSPARPVSPEPLLTLKLQLSLLTPGLGETAG